VRAVCSNCHVPHDWTDKMARKMQASKEVWGKIFGTIDTPEKFQAKRLELAQHEWARSRPTIRWSAATATTTTPWIDPPEPACAEHAQHLSGQQGKDLYRLPQGHCPQAAAHSSGTGPSDTPGQKVPGPATPVAQAK
jgi:cytochrome c-type protein NapC